MSAPPGLLRNILIPSIPFIGVLGIWQAAVSFYGVSPILLPSPISVADAAAANADELFAAAWSTMLDVVLATVITAIIGYLTAIILSLSPLLRRSAFPYLLMTQVLPKVALAPLLFAWFGIGPQSRLLLAVSIAYFPMVINTLDAFLTTDSAMVNYSRSLGASDWQTLVKVRVPAALPATLGGVKISASLAIVGVVVGEFIATNDGLGRIVIESTALMQTSRMLAATLAIALLGIGLLGAIELIERRVVRWSVVQ